VKVNPATGKIRILETLQVSSGVYHEVSFKRRGNYFLLADEYLSALDKLEDSQNRSPGISFESFDFFGRFGRLKKSQFWYLFAIACLDMDADLSLYIPILDRNKGFLSALEIGQLNALRKFWYQKGPSASVQEKVDFLEYEIFPFSAPRRLKGFLCDPVIAESLKKKLGRIIRVSQRRTEKGRIRGYRDHGSARSSSTKARQEANTEVATTLRNFAQKKLFEDLESENIHVRTTAHLQYSNFLELIERLYPKLE